MDGSTDPRIIRTPGVDSGEICRPGASVHPSVDPAGPSTRRRDRSVPGRGAVGSTPWSPRTALSPAPTPGRHRPDAGPVANVTAGRACLRAPRAVATTATCRRCHRSGYSRPGRGRTTSSCSPACSVRRHGADRHDVPQRESHASPVYDPSATADCSPRCPRWLPHRRARRPRQPPQRPRDPGDRVRRGRRHGRRDAADRRPRRRRGDPRPHRAVRHRRYRGRQRCST
jgi:hypothetical protein